MRHRKKGVVLSRTASARKELIRKLAVSFIAHGSIQSTPAKARYVQPFVERLLTRAKSGDLAARREMIAALGNRAAAAALLKHAERFRDRPGGYTRVTRLPTVRSGDGAAVVQLEFV